MKHIHIMLTLVTAITLLSCSSGEEKHNFTLNGTWVLEEIQRWEGDSYTFDQEDKTWLRIYDNTCYYECQVVAAPSGMMFVPYNMEHYTLIERGPNDYLYLQESNTHPLTVESDSTIVIQETGNKYRWKVCDSYDARKVAKIVDIIRVDMENPGEGGHRYLFSYAEQELETTNHTLIYSLVCIVLGAMVILNFAYLQYSKRRRVEQELQRIEQERASLPQPVREALNSVEEDFHKSDFYLNLRQRITRGELLQPEDWQAIEEHFRSVYPRFATTLLTLRNMSPIELQVCQLLKLGVPPSEIANVLCKDTSSISSIRSRLYKKVFGEKGGSKDWDEFILSL